jgi:phosphotransferase system enzyme I (PtsI)
LQNLPLFKTQLRAILRASVEGPVSVMFPLISSVMELRQAKMILNDVKEDLDDEGIEYSSDIPIGIMIEVPSAALQAHTLSREADFFSIGTNDLVQYTLAADRGNERIADLYTAGHPAVLQLLKMSIDAAAHASIDISICGEMAGEPEYLMLLLGLGLRTLSITPPAIPEAKKVIRSLDITQCKKVASWAQNFDSDRGVTNFLRNEIRKIVPEVFDGRSIG